MGGLTNRVWRIAQVCADRGIAPGSTKGAAQHLRGIAAGLTELGHHVDTYTSRRAEGPFPVAVRPLPDLFANSGPMDLVYERYSLGHTDGLDHARSLGVPFVLEVNAPLLDEAVTHRPKSVLPEHPEAERRLLAEADLVITVSSPLSEWAQTHRSGPVSTIPNGFEPSWFRPPVASAEPARLLFLGHPKPWHGADRVPEIVAALVGRGHDVEALLIGGGSGIADVEARAAQLGVGDRIQCTGALAPQEATALLATGVVGLAPYRRQEPFYFCPLKVVDYLAAGLPIVATAQGDIPGLVGDAGIVVEPDDDAALYSAVERLVIDPERRSAMAARGRARAAAELTWAATARRTAEAVAGLLGAEPSPALATAEGQ